MVTCSFMGLSSNFWYSFALCGKDAKSCSKRFLEVEKYATSTAANNATKNKEAIKHKPVKAIKSTCNVAGSGSKCELFSY